MKEYGALVDDVFQGTNLYPVLQEFEGLLKDGKIHIGDNDLLKIHMYNAALKYDTNRDRAKLIKLNQYGHIDGLAALIDALTVRQKWYAEIGEQLKNE
jgi:phage terminase large subunit-like protein